MMMDGTPPQAPGDNAPPPPPPAAPPPTAPTPPSGGKVSDNRTIWIVLSYLGPLALIPLVAEKDDAEVKWHAKHGLVLFVGEIAIFLILGILSFALSTVGIGCLGCLVWWGLCLVFLVVHILCIVKGVGGERFLIPWISELADRF
jgi:uncharacterized membrane protein